MQKCLNISDEVELIEYLKVADAKSLTKCNVLTSFGLPTWAPSLECTNASAPFLTKTPDEIYSSCEAQQKDAMFSVVDQVLNLIYLSTTEFSSSKESVLFFV